MAIVKVLLALLAALLATVALAGCKSTPNPYETPLPTRSLLEVKHHAGGTHYCTLVHRNVWYQTFSNSLLLLDRRPAVVRSDSSVVDTIELGEFGFCGAATDLALRGDSLFVLLERDQVIEFAIDDPLAPREVRRLSSPELGIQPTHLAVANDHVFISGFGGIVRLRTQEELLVPEKDKDRPKDSPIALDVEAVVAGDQEFGPVVMTSQALVTTIGRRIVTVPDLMYLGSANVVIELPPSLGGPQRVAYQWDGDEGSVIGLMGADFRELNRKAFLSGVHRLKVLNDALWVVADDVVVSFAVNGDELVEQLRVPVYGARDVDVINDNYLAVAGTFGRSLYRIEADDTGPGDSFISTVREASRLEQSMYDGRFVLAGSREGFWLYEIERGATLADRGAFQPAEPERTTRTLRSSATLNEDGTSLSVTGGDGDFEFPAPPGTRLLCLASVDGDIWIGHEHGIIVLSGESPSPEVLAELKIPGPVHTIYPLRVGGGVTYVSTLGGVGVARWFVEQLPFPED